MKSFIFIVLCCSFQLSLEAQNRDIYRYDQDYLTAGFHRSRRTELRSEMPANSVAVFFSSPERIRNNDNDFEYHQDAEFYYMTGFTEPNAVLLVFKDSTIIKNVKTDEILFVPDPDPGDELWTGRRAGIEGAKKWLGIQAAILSSEFDAIDFGFSNYSKVMFALPKGIVDDKSENNDLFDLVESFKNKMRLSHNEDTYLLGSLVSGLREIKQPEEITLLRKAISISGDAHLEMMKSLKQGMAEYQVQAVGEYVFKKGGAECVAYPSICGGGENSVILHYSSNRRTLVEGDMIVIDMGAEYHGYAADITRTLPVSGHFSEEQRLIYELVLKAQEAGFAACMPGNAFSDPHLAAVDVIKNGLVALEIIKNGADYKRYFMHGTSHYLGLDVHDAGSKGPLKPGNIITVEPGIYIAEGSPCDPKWWNIGIRIEDDVLINPSGYENLSVKVPRTIIEIEKMMKETPTFIK